MQSWEKVNNFLTSAFSSPYCRVTKEAVSAFGCKIQAAFLAEAFRMLWEESIFITCLMLQFAWLSMRSSTLLSLESFCFKRDLCHRNWVLPTFILLTKDALTSMASTHKIRWENKNIHLQDVFYGRKQCSGLLCVKGFWMPHAGSQSCADCIHAGDRKVTCHRGRSEQMPNLHHKSVHWKGKPC